MIPLEVAHLAEILAHGGDISDEHYAEANRIYDEMCGRGWLFSLNREEAA